MELTDRDRAILDFEATWWEEPGPKEALVAERFELSASRYYQLLNGLLDTDEAYAYNALLVRRLRRLRQRRQRARQDVLQAGEQPAL